MRRFKSRAGHSHHHDANPGTIVGTHSRVEHASRPSKDISGGSRFESSAGTHNPAERLERIPRHVRGTVAGTVGTW